MFPGSCSTTACKVLVDPCLSRVGARALAATARPWLPLGHAASQSCGRAVPELLEEARCAQHVVEVFDAGPVPASRSIRTTVEQPYVPEDVNRVQHRIATHRSQCDGHGRGEGHVPQRVWGGVYPRSAEELGPKSSPSLAKKESNVEVAARLEQHLAGVGQHLQLLVVLSLLVNRFAPAQDRLPARGHGHSQARGECMRNERTAIATLH